MFDIDVISLVHELAGSPTREFNAILTKKTVWFGRIINYFQPKNGVDVHSTTYTIQDLIEKDPSVLKQSMFIRDAIKLTNKLHTHVYALLKKNPNAENQRLLSFVLSLEGCVLTRVAGDQALEVIQSIKSRLATENVIYYLAGAGFNQNTPLATACCSYIKENRTGIRKLKEYIQEKPEKTIRLLNAGCLAKDDFVIKMVWESICLNKNLEAFKADRQLTSALDYLLNKKEFSNQTLSIGDLQKPQEVLVSKEILAQRNAYFSGLFQEGFSERSQSVIALKDMDLMGKVRSIDYEGFLCLLRYIYTGTFDIPLQLCPVVSHLADMYLEPGLKEICDQKTS